MVKGENVMSKIPNTKVVVALLLFVLVLLLAVPFVRAEIEPKPDAFYRTITEQHFNLAVAQFEQKDVFGACSNLRISKGYARHINDKIVYEHITLLLDKMCSDDS
jgi:hypothetical protein